MTCPACRQDAKFVGYRTCEPICLFGKIVYERAYYHCKHCHTGHFPTDEEFDLEDRKSTGARELISMVGVLDPFEESAKRVLPRLTGLNVSASTVRRTAEAVGQDVADRRAAGETFGTGADWKWNTDLSGRQVAYVGLDATGVRQQGPRGEKAECRMPWVGLVFNPQPPKQKRRGRIWDTRYVAGLMSLDEISSQLRAECQSVGVGQADVVVCLTDGGNGLEDCLVKTLGGIARDMEFILDFYHASEHLTEFAKQLIRDEDKRTDQVSAWCHQLKHQGGASLLAELESLDLQSASAEAKESHRLLLGYLRSNQHRMDYPRYIKNGWQIGSGMVESACKTVVCQRLKESGMRWREYGTTTLTHLRALYRSEPALWRNYWAPL